MYATADNRRIVAKRWNPVAGQSTVWDVVVPFSGGADTVFYANFVEKRGGISVIASTIQYAIRKDVHTGRWPIFAVRNP